MNNGGEAARPAAAGPTSTQVAVAAGVGQLGGENPGTLAGRLLPLVGIGAASAAATRLAGGPDSSAVAFDLFLLLLGGLFLVTLHALRA